MTQVGVVGALVLTIQMDVAMQIPNFDWEIVTDKWGETASNYIHDVIFCMMALTITGTVLGKFQYLFRLLAISETESVVELEELLALQGSNLSKGLTLVWFSTVGTILVLVTFGACQMRILTNFFITAVIVIAIASYVLFGILGGSGRALVLKVVVMIVFTLVAVLGFSFNLWWVAAAIAGHGVFDLLHDRLITNPGVPAWWPAFCMAIDVGLAAWLAWLLLRGRIRPVGPRSEPQPFS